MTPDPVLADLPPPPPDTWRRRATYLRYRAIWAGVAALPEPAARRLPDLLGPAWMRAAPARQRDQVRRNQARVARHPDDETLDDLVRRAYVSYARYWVDAFRLHTMDADAVVADATGHHLDVLDDVLADGRGAILATAHLGSWDIGALFSAERGWPMVAVAELLQPRRLFERFVALRRRAGIDVIPRARGMDVTGRLVAAVGAGKLATLLADRDLGRRGPVVEFFGEPCRLPAGTATLARRTGRPVVVGAFVVRDDGGYHAEVLPDRLDVSDLPVDVGTQVVARGLEDLIGRYPEQWHVFVPNWLADREPRHPAVAGGPEPLDVEDPRATARPSGPPTGTA